MLAVRLYFYAIPQAADFYLYAALITATVLFKTADKIVTRNHPYTQKDA